MINKLTLAVLAATAGLLLPTTIAFAASAEATRAVNVRADNDNEAKIRDTLEAGEVVEVDRCEAGWCYVNHDGPDGWVYSGYLTAPGGDDDEEDVVVADDDEDEDEASGSDDDEAVGDYEDDEDDDGRDIDDVEIAGDEFESISDVID